MAIWCMLFADDIILVAETINGVNTKIEMWWREFMLGLS